MLPGGESFRPLSGISSGPFSLSRPKAGRWLLAIVDKHWLDMLLQQVLRDQPPNDIGMGFQGPGVGVPHLGGHFEPHVDKLAEVAIVGRAFPIVAQRRRILCTGTSLNCLRL